MSSKRSRSPRTRPKGAAPEGKSRPAAVARKPEPEKRDENEALHVPTWRTRLRRYFPSVLITNGLFLTVAVAFALIALTATGTPMAALAATTAETWMVMHLIPAVGRDQTVAIMPLLPAMLIFVFVAHRTYRAVKDKVSLADLGVLAALVLGVPTLVTVAMWAMLLDAAVVYDLSPPNLAVAIGWTLLLHGAAMIVGMRERLWKALARRFGVPAWLVDAARAAWVTVQMLLVVACVFFIVMLVARHQFATEATANFTTAGTFGAWVLGVAYLPNMVVHALSYLLGSEILLGPGVASVFGVNMVQLPPLPVLAGIPASAPAWAPVVLLAPAIVLGVRTFRGQGEAWNVRGGLVQAGFATIYMFVLVLAAGGTLGVYGYFGANLWLTPLVTFLWFAVVLSAGAAIALFMKKAGSTSPSEEPSTGAESTHGDTHADAEAESESPDAEADEEASEHEVNQPPGQPEAAADEPSDAEEATQGTSQQEHSEAERDQVLQKPEGAQPQLQQSDEGETPEEEVASTTETPEVATDNGAQSEHAQNLEADAETDTEADAEADRAELPETATPEAEPEATSESAAESERAESGGVETRQESDSEELRQTEQEGDAAPR